MSGVSNELPVTQDDFLNDDKKSSKNSVKYYQNRAGQLQRRIFQGLSKYRSIITIMCTLCFLAFWISDSDSVPSEVVSSGSRHMQSNIPFSVNLNNPSWWNPTSWFFNRDPKIVIILAANDGGGVLRWKNEQEWSIERLSIKNKRAYAKRHGYGLTIKDLTVSKRYSHEYREGWQKVDILKQSMREFPNAEWFWWLDLDTLIMEPDRSLESHLFSRLDYMVDRTLNHYNPLGIKIDIPYVDYTQSIDLLITQDCGGFNLGSFLIRNSEWSKQLVDIWFEPVAYEQKHMVWEHKEQDTLESLYATEAWIRSRVGFLPLRAINAFPPGACSEFSGDQRFFYSSKTRDFVVNMAGCNFGRDCWGEMSYYTTLMEKFQSRWYSRLFS